MDTYYYSSNFELAAYTWAYNAVIQQVMPLGLRFAINPQNSKTTAVEVVESSKSCTFLVYIVVKVCLFCLCSCDRYERPLYPPPPPTPSTWIRSFQKSKVQPPSPGGSVVDILKSPGPTPP